MYDQAETGCFLPQTNMPVYRWPQPSRRHLHAGDQHLLYHIAIDPEQQHPIDNVSLEAQYAERLQQLLKQYEAPATQYSRVGLTEPREEALR